MIQLPIISAAFFLTVYPAAAVTLLLNPGFEANPLAPATNITISEADYEAAEISHEIPGWAYSGVAGYLASGGASSGYWGSSSRFASHFVAIGNFGDGVTSSSLVQSFTMTSAGSFNFSFEWQSGTFSESSSYGNSVGGAGLLSMRIYLSGGEIAGETEFLSESGQQGNLSVNGVSLPSGPARMEITFNHQSVGGVYNHVFIDNVQATSIPEPSSLVILGAGLGCSVFRRRRCYC